MLPRKHRENTVSIVRALSLSLSFPKVKRKGEQNVTDTHFKFKKNVNNKVAHLVSLQFLIG